VLTRPEALSDSRVAEAVVDGWGLGVGEIEYAPVGFGSYHWRVTADGAEWFVTADDLVAKRRHGAESPRTALRRLSAALSTARTLSDEGLTFVVAPRPTESGRIVIEVDDRYAIALYPHIEGDTHAWGPYPSRNDRLAVLDLIVALHTAPASTRRDGLVDDLVIPARDQLIAALGDPSGPWKSGPFGEPARLLLVEHVDTVVRLLDRYDDLALSVSRGEDRMVVTHGEPHRANTITTGRGVVLIDWDTALIAAPERDLWALGVEDPQILDDYEEKTGITPNSEALELYRLWWDLTEISLYIGQFRSPHSLTDDTSLAWKALDSYLDPSRW
jgi:spectinomycin phosphotransferase/16S rRNA (guanine(1405)-N(7))-methyltransferase